MDDYEMDILSGYINSFEKMKSISLIFSDNRITSKGINILSKPLID